MITHHMAKIKSECTLKFFGKDPKQGLDSEMNLWGLLILEGDIQY